MSGPLKKNCDEKTVNQRCETFQQVGDPMLASSSTPSPGVFAAEEDAGWGSAAVSSNTTTSTSGVNNTAHSRSYGGAYSDASSAARTNYGAATPSTITYPANFWRQNLSSNSMYNSYSPGMYGQMPLYPPSGGPSSCLPFTLQSGYAAPQAMFGPAAPSPESAGLLHYAHEQSRGVFEKAAYTIQTVGSITHMLDTIFMGCTGSFNAILTVIGQLSQLKNHFGRVISAFAVLRSIRWLYARVLRALGLRSAQDVEEAWREAVEGMAAQQTASGGGRRSRGSWRRAVLLACLCALPALLWQLMKALTYDETTATLGPTDRPGTDPRLSGEAPGLSGSDPRAVPFASGYQQSVNPAYGSLGGYGASTYPFGGQPGGYNPYGTGGSLYGGYTPTGCPPSTYNASPYARYGAAYPSYNGIGGNYYSGIGAAQSSGGVPAAPPNYAQRNSGQPPSGLGNQKDFPSKGAAKNVHFADQNSRIATATDAK